MRDSHHNCGKHSVSYLCHAPALVHLMTSLASTSTAESLPFCISSQDSQELSTKLINAQKILVCAIVPTTLVDP